MVNVAFRGLNVIVDKIETTHEGKAYSSEILPALKEKYGDILFIIGGDSLRNFRKWHHPFEIVKVCPIVVVPRGADDIAELKRIASTFMSEWGGNIEVSEGVRGEDISSTVLRADIELGMPSEYLSEDVRRIAEDARLYTSHQAMIDRVRSVLPEKRWRHTCGVVETGLRMGEPLGIPAEKVFVSCLLHDCMKYAETAHAGVPADAVGTKVMHAFNGAEEAKIAYGVEDEDVLDAIRYHTTGRAGMSTLEKLVYVADMIEPNRTFDGVEHLREVTFKDLDEGFRLCLRRSYEVLLERGKPIYHLTVECYNAYCKGEGNGD